MTICIPLAPFLYAFLVVVAVGCPIATAIIAHSVWCRISGKGKGSKSQFIMLFYFSFIVPLYTCKNLYWYKTSHRSSQLTWKGKLAEGDMTMWSYIGNWIVLTFTWWISPIVMLVTFVNHIHYSAQRKRYRISIA